MYSKNIYDDVQSLLRDGLTHTQVSKLMNIPRTTVRDMIKSKRLSSVSLTNVVEPRAYSFILGMYLGDGHISKMNRTWRIRIFQDAKYPNIVKETEDALRKFHLNNKVTSFATGGTMITSMYSKHLVELFPQHGDGKKHERCLKLCDWQQEIVDTYAWDFLRGLIWSDGCIHVHKKNKNTAISLSNTSEEIHQMFIDVCHKLGIHPSHVPNTMTTYISKKNDVSKVLCHIDIKS